MGNQILWMRRRRGVTPMTAITAVTTGAQTLTLQQLTPTGGDCVVDWGDGSALSTITDGNTGTTTHDYAGAGTYQVTVSNPHLLTAIDLRDAKILLDTSKMGGIVPANLEQLRFDSPAAGSVFSSAHFTGATISREFRIYMNNAGTYTFDSAHFAGSDPSNIMYLLFNQAGTYTFDSADFAGATPDTSLYIYFNQAGTYTFDSAHFATAQPASNLTFLLHSSATTTIAQADWNGIARKAASPNIQMGLDQTEVDAVLLGIYDDFANRTASNGTLNVAGSNAAPSGTLQAQCPPTTGKEAAYELVNDSCGVSSNQYAAVTITT